MRLGLMGHESVGSWWMQTACGMKAGGEALATESLRILNPKDGENHDNVDNKTMDPIPNGIVQLHMALQTRSARTLSIA